ncbi:MAG: citrate (Si)-synthase [Chlorobiota bacterium]
MSLLKQKLSQVLPPQVKEIKEFVKANADAKVSDVTLAQAYGGIRGVKATVCDTSEVPPTKGLVIRGRELGELTDKLPEEILWLLLTGELPNSEELADLQQDLQSRQDVPTYVWNVLNEMPSDSHPMAMFNSAILVMQRESKFAKNYNNIKKSEYWEYTLEDALDIIAKLPSIAAYVYRKRFDKGDRIEPKAGADLGENYAHMLGLNDENGNFAKLMRLYLTLHSDHEGGNVSAFSAATVNSALSDMYYSLSAGLNGLAGPLHGLANQQCLKWVLDTMDKFDGVPSEEQIEKYTWETLDAGKVIPGYGHAVLRVTDPRFTAFHKFGVENCSEDPVFQTVDRVFKVVPKVLDQVEKISNPWPNVDAGSGSLLYHFGLKEFEYYTVLFSVSRAIGISSQAVIARAYGLPITRPKSLPTSKFKELVNG